MSLEYVNRRGDRYYVLEGRTKTGKPKYYCSKRPGENTVECLPEGYEVHERPADAMVVVRKVRRSRVAPFEREQLARLADSLASVPAVVDVEGDSLIVYASDTNPDESIRAMTILLGTSLGDEEQHRQWIAGNSRYSPMFRFTLSDEDRRLYSVERWCYLGSIDRWMPLLRSGPLEELADEYLPHLGEESFFELT